MGQCSPRIAFNKATNGLFVAFLKAMYAENLNIVLSSRYEKAFIFNRLCVLICFLER